MTLPSATAPKQSTSDRETVLVLVDEIGAGGLPDRTRALLRALCASVRPVLVAQRYGKPSWRIGKAPWTEEVYAFPAQDYNANVKRFAADLVRRHAPAWLLAYGWENTQLVVELSEHDVPILVFADDVSSNPNAEGQLGWASYFADRIVLPEAILPHARFAFRGGVAPHDALASRFGVFDAPEAIPKQRRLGGLLASRSDVGDRVDVARRLVEVGRQTIVERTGLAARLHRDAATIEAAGAFDAGLAVPPRDATDTQSAILAYLRMSHRLAPLDREGVGPILRRPMAGFHPLVYATDCAGFDYAAGEDPFAHFLRSERPEGRWTHEIIAPQADAVPRAEFRVALHAHMHYPELLPELLARLAFNATPVDLFITTTSDDRRAAVAGLLDRAGIVPAMLVSEPSNRGRDIWPFLALLGAGAFAGYDVVGHVHGKRSPAHEAGMAWKDFLWRHLVGQPEAMMDRILAAFARETRLGLVIAEDPHLESWAGNKAIASELAVRIGVALPLPAYFEFPVGTMFWTRPEAMAPLVDLHLTPDMIPPEPLPVDGTLLHALERLIPFAAEKAGFEVAAAYVPGCAR
jgi:Rhamnan synthesis protein F